MTLHTLKDIYDRIKIFSKNLQSTSDVLIGKKSAKTTLLSTLQTLITKGSSEVGFLRSKKLVCSDKAGKHCTMSDFFSSTTVRYYSYILSGKQTSKSIGFAVKKREAIVRLVKNINFYFPEGSLSIF